MGVRLLASLDGAAPVSCCRITDGLVAQKECKVTTSANTVRPTPFESEWGGKGSGRVSGEGAGGVELSTHLKVFPTSTKEASEGGGDVRQFYTTCPLCVTEEEEWKENDEQVDVCS